MIKNALILTLSITLVACSTPEKPAMNAKEQVSGIKQMCTENMTAIKQRQQTESLYSRLGGTAGIEKLSTQLYQAHKGNEKIGHLFNNVPEQPFVDNVTEFLVHHAGGDGNYTGRDMQVVHRDLGITHEDFLAAGGDVQNVMSKLGHGENEIQEAVCFLVSFVPQVVTR